MKYEIKPNLDQTVTGTTQPIVKRPLYLYVKVPLAWIEDCSKLKGSCLALAIHLLWVHYVTKKNPVKPQGARLKALGVTRYSSYRALKKLKAVGLIKSETQKGAFPAVTLLYDNKNLGESSHGN